MNRIAYVIENFPIHFYQQVKKEDIGTYFKIF